MNKTFSAPKKILIPTDFSETANIALPYAAALARENGAAVELIHVTEDPVLWMDYANSQESVLKNIRKKREELALDKLKKLQHEFFEGCDLAINALWSVESAATAIVDHARTDNFDLIVIATHGHGFPKRAIVGSVAERIMRRSSCATLIVPARRPHEHLPNKPKHLPCKKIAVATDFSLASHAAIGYAKPYQLINKASLSLVHVLSDLSSPDMGIDGNTSIHGFLELQATYRQYIYDQLIALRRELGVEAAECVVLDRAYSVANTLGDFTKENNIDLLIVASQSGGRHPYSIGGVAEGVVRKVDCPVLMVP